MDFASASITNPGQAPYNFSKAKGSSAATMRCTLEALSGSQFGIAVHKAYPAAVHAHLREVSGEEGPGAVQDLIAGEMST